MYCTSMWMYLYICLQMRAFPLLQLDVSLSQDAFNQALGRQHIQGGRYRAIDYVEVQIAELLLSHLVQWPSLEEVGASHGTDSASIGTYSTSIGTDGLYWYRSASVIGITACRARLFGCKTGLSIQFPQWRSACVGLFGPVKLQDMDCLNANSA